MTNGYDPPFRLTITTLRPGGRGEPSWEDPRERRFASLADALDFTKVQFEEDDEHRKKRPNQLPVILDARLEGPEGLVLSGPALRREAAKIRD